MSNDWLGRLREAYEAGYYQTEADIARQTGFPWQNTVCRDCPYWMEGYCQVDLSRTFADKPVCELYDPPDHELANFLIAHRLRTLWTKRWRWQGRR